jgi:hypothetical protein
MLNLERRQCSKTRVLTHVAAAKPKAVTGVLHFEQQRVVAISANTQLPNITYTYT